MYDKYIIKITKLIENREKYQLIMGKVSHEIQEVGGSLKGFAEDLRETTGQVISYKTLQNYAWVHSRTSHLKLPEDISYRARQAIAGSEDPERWVKEIKNGASSAQIFRMIKGEPEIKKCPFCGESL